MRRAAALICVALTLLPTVAAAQEGGRSTEDPWRFVSVPDFLNADVADVSSAPGWDGGLNATSPDLERVVDGWLDAIAGEQPEFVLVAGDLVQGMWDLDADGRELFGPVDTLEQQRAAIRTAGDVIYPQWLARFNERDLTVHAAVGDHDIGDNSDWEPTGGALVDAYRRVWADHLTDGRYSEHPNGTSYDRTAYAVRVRNVLIVTVDTFEVISGGVRTAVAPEQLDWLDEVLSETDADHVIVQGHLPVLGPVRTYFSSGLMLEDGADSEFWKLLCRHDVDLYLAGEAHDVTHSDGCVTQVVHGANVGPGGFVNYLVVDVGPDDLHLRIERAEVTTYGSRRIWQTELKRPFAEMTLGSFETVGTGTVGGDWSGVLEPVAADSDRRVPVVALLALAGLSAALVLLRLRRRLDTATPRRIEASTAS